MKNPPSSARVRSVLIIELLVLLLIAVSTSSTAKAQDTSTNVLDGFTPAGLQAGSPTGAFPLSGFDVVNPYNGNLSLSLPLLKAGGRGSAGYTLQQPITTQWTVTYSRVDNGMGGVWEFYEPTLNAGPQPRPYSAGIMVGRMAQDEINSWICYGYYDPVYLPSKTLTRLTFVGPDGTSIEFRDQLLQGAPASVPSCATSSANRGKIFTTWDGQSATFISDDDIYDSIVVQSSPQMFGPSGYLKWRDGAVYRIDGGEVSWIRDRNGNKLTFTYSGTIYSPQTVITDSLNRQITIDYNYNDPTYGLCNRIRYKGYGGAQRTIWVTMGSMSTALRSGYSIQALNSLFPLYNASNYQFNPNVVTAVWLPNGKKYSFYYNNYGEVARVVLPTGGAYEYDWGAGLTSGPPSGITCSCPWSIIYRRVWERRVYSNGGTGSSYDHKITFSRPESFDSGGNFGNLGYVTVNQYNSSSALLTSEKHYYYGGAFISMLSSPTSYSPWNEGKEYQTDIFASDGTTVLRRTETGWSQRSSVSWWMGPGESPSADPIVVSTTNTLVDTNEVSKTTFSYDQYNNQTGVYEYDYGTGAAGSLIRSTLTSYLTTNPVNSLDYTSNSIHIRNLPVQRSIYGSVENTRVTFEYDNYATDTNHAGLVSRANISGFDSTFNTGNTSRGNSTGVTSYLLSGGSVTGSVSAYFQFDIAGNVVKSIDARGNATIIEYDDRYGTPDGEATSNPGPTDLGSLTSYGFATRINRQGQITIGQFDYYLGRLVDIQDINSIVASVYYDDGLDRPTQIKRAVSTGAASHTVFAYDDTARKITTTTDLNNNNDGGLVTKVLYDQMGRTTETQQYEGGSNYISAQVQYDALGRPYKTSNPFRPWQSETAVWTIQAFDVLGRVTSVTTTDNAVFGTSYSGNSVTVTDQAGRKRKSVTDALGRLTSVYEDPNGSNYQTSYAYDVLDNLTTVTQGSQTRTFVYDSLKRLTSASNPESGTVTFGYDNNGNLTGRIDARSITTTMTYDALNRITSKSYNDSPQTPTVNFYYDAQTLPSGAPSFDRGFSTGRLVAVTYGGTTAGTYMGYDQMGRVVRQYQRTDSINYLVEASYFANSSVQSITYPAVPGASDRRTVNYTNDSAGRTASLSSSATSYAPGASVSNIGYAPHNSLVTQTYGNALIHAVSYNNRLQPTEIKLGTSGAPTSVIDLVYSYGTTGNNGTLQNVSYSGGGLSYTETFSYDALNRLTTAQENSGSNWSQTNGYDRYGNRWIDLGGGNQSLYFTASSNRITGWSYDNAGNLLNDTYHSYAYDAENKTSKVDGTSAYVYDGTGQRVRKLVGENLRFVYGIGGQLLAEFNGSTGVLTKEYIYGVSGLLATIEPTAINSNGTRYTTPDHLGSPRVVTNSSAGVVSRHDYMPFGEELGSGVGGRSTGIGFGVADGERQKFTQKERDTETGLDYFGARYYGCSLGRFTTADPLMASGRASAPQSWNRYSYVLNNPVNLIDPNGLDVDDPQDPKKKDPRAATPQPAPTPTESPLPKVTVATSTAPGTTNGTAPVRNVQLADGTFATGVVAPLTITVTDQSGKPLEGLTVTETNKVTESEPTLPFKENTSSVTTDDKGSFTDVVFGNARVTSDKVSSNDATTILQNQLETPTKVVTEQTLTISAPGKGVIATAVYSRTITNLDDKGNLRPAVENGRHVNNFRVNVGPVTVSRPKSP
ncbi:MAG TPA: RHS repeat-associated core domain-containing protein [Pyrinomonadaceae bacterium]|nr:RHS repeat-associated core domain-containing protein [Pyrinomonadaceae bacterium]